MHTVATQLQFLLVAVLSLLGLAAAGSVLLIMAMQRREEATERPRAAYGQAQWQSQLRAWRRRYALAAAALAAVVVLFGVLAFSRQMA